MGRRQMVRTGSKICPKCGDDKPYSDFPPRVSRPIGIWSYCTPCETTRQRTRAAKRYETHKTMGCCTACGAPVWRHGSAHCEAHRQLSRRYNHIFRANVLAHYGAQCHCCGEAAEEFLTVDHVDGRSSSPTSARKGRKLYGWLQRNNYPPGFQLLCWNCNLAKYLYGACPHSKNPLVPAVTGVNLI